jgi:hypothetical protein
MPILPTEKTLLTEETSEKGKNQRMIAKAFIEKEDAHPHHLHL